MSTRSGFTASLVALGSIFATILGAQAQTKGAFLYGAGVNIDMTRHIGVRGEYRGMLVKVPDFGVATLTMDTTTHLAQPSGGIYFRF